MLTKVATFAVQAIPGADGAGLTLLEIDRADLMTPRGDRDDAGGVEVQDTCHGHPNNFVGYHFFSLMPCIPRSALMPYPPHLPPLTIFAPATKVQRKQRIPGNFDRAKLVQ